MSHSAESRGWVPTPNEQRDLLHRLDSRRVRVNTEDHRWEWKHTDAAERRLAMAALMVPDAESLSVDDRHEATMAAYRWLGAEEARAVREGWTEAEFYEEIGHLEGLAEQIYLDNEYDPDEARMRAQMDVAEDLAHLFGRMMEEDRTANEVLAELEVSA